MASLPETYAGGESLVLAIIDWLQCEMMIAPIGDTS